MHKYGFWVLIVFVGKRSAMMDQEKKLEEMTRDHETTQAKIPPVSMIVPIRNLNHIENEG
jgi:hypothetical protein